MPILGFLKLMFLLSRKACLLYKRSKINFSRFIFTIYYIKVQGVTKGYMGLLGVTGAYKGLQEVTRGYRGLQGVKGGYKELQGVTKNYRNFFLCRTFRNTFSWLILHRNRS